jgi:hypothetical protein
LGKYPADFALQVDKGRLEQRFTRIEDHQPSGREFGQVQPDRLPHPALHSIPYDGFAACARNRKSHSRASHFRTGHFAVGQAKCGEVLAGEAIAFVIYRAEVAPAQNAGALWEAESGPGDRDELAELGVSNVAFVAYGKLVAAFGPPPGKDGPAILGFHALAEAVSLGPLPIIRLKRTFWHFVNPKRRVEPSERVVMWSQNSDYKASLCPGATEPLEC